MCVPQVKQIPPDLTEMAGQAFQIVPDLAMRTLKAADVSEQILHKQLVLQVKEQLDSAKVTGLLFDTSSKEEVNILDKIVAAARASAQQEVSAPEPVAVQEETVAPSQQAPGEASSQPYRPPARAESPPRHEFNRSKLASFFNLLYVRRNIFCYRATIVAVAFMFLCRIFSSNQAAYINYSIVRQGPLVFQT